jgi:serine/threonine protein kinase
MAGPGFEILEIVASGAFGSVCKARRDDGVVVALKVLKQVVATNVRAMTRLRDEARMLARLQHVNILRVHRLLEVEGCPVVGRTSRSPDRADPPWWAFWVTLRDACRRNTDKR